MENTEEHKHHHHHHRHHHHHHHREKEVKNQSDTEAGNQTTNISTTVPLHASSSEKSYSDDPDTTQFIENRGIKDGGHVREKKENKPSILNFMTDRRVSQAEMQKRYNWLQRTRLSVGSVRNRCRITHEVRLPETYNGAYCTRFSQNGDLIITSFGNGGIQIRNGETGDLRTTLKSGLETSFPVICCRFNPIQPELFYASSACGNIFACTTNTNEFSRFIEEPKNEVNTIDVNVSGEYIVSGGKDAIVRLYDAGLGKMILMYKRHEATFLGENVNRYHRMRIFASKFHPTYSNLIITGGWDDTVKIWDIRVSDGSIREIKGPHICGDAIDVRENNILTGSWVVRGSLQIWDIMSTKLIDTINPQNRPTTLDGEFLYAVQYFDGDPYGDIVLAGGSGTGAVEVISLKEKKVMGSFQVKKAVISLDSCRTTIVFGGMEALLRIAEYS